jgi:hypothetical protein
MNRLDVMEIESIGCVCSKCGTAMVLKLSTAQYNGKECPNCGSSGYLLHEVLAQLAEVHQKVVAAKLNLRFRVPTKAD